MSTRYCRFFWAALCSGAMLFNAVGCARPSTPWASCDDAYLHLELYKHKQIEFRLLRGEIELYSVMDSTFETPGWRRAVFKTWPGASIVAIHKDGQSHRVYEYGSFANCVDLRSPEDAAELFRFFSRREVWPLMPDRNFEFEVYPDPNEPTQEDYPVYASEIPPEVWKSHGLAEPWAVSMGDHFEVVRFVIRENPLTDSRRLYKVMERIGCEGKGYERLSEEEVTPTPSLVDDVRRFGVL